MENVHGVLYNFLSIIILQNGQDFLDVLYVLQYIYSLARDMHFNLTAVKSNLTKEEEYIDIAQILDRICLMF